MYLNLAQIFGFIRYCVTILKKKCFAQKLEGIQKSIFDGDLDFDLEVKFQDNLKVKLNFLNGNPYFWHKKWKEWKISIHSMESKRLLGVLCWSNQWKQWISAPTIDWVISFTLKTTRFWCNNYVMNVKLNWLVLGKLHFACYSCVCICFLLFPIIAVSNWWFIHLLCLIYFVHNWDLPESIFWIYATRPSVWAINRYRFNNLLWNVF